MNSLFLRGLTLASTIVNLMAETIKNSKEWPSIWNDILNDIEMSRNLHAPTINATITGVITIMFVLLHEL